MNQEETEIEREILGGSGNGMRSGRRGDKVGRGRRSEIEGNLGDRGEEKVFVGKTTATGKAGRMRSRKGGGGDRWEWGGRREVRGGETREWHYNDPAAAAAA